MKGWWHVAELSINFAGHSPRRIRFWLASAPPSNSRHAGASARFEAGWGGAVWKTIGASGGSNVSNRYGAWHYGGQKMVAINNVELISDRPLEVKSSRDCGSKTARGPTGAGRRLGDGGVQAGNLA